MLRFNNCANLLNIIWAKQQQQEKKNKKKKQKKNPSQAISSVTTKKKKKKQNRCNNLLVDLDLTYELGIETIQWLSSMFKQIGEITRCTGANIMGPKQTVVGSLYNDL